MKPHIERIPGYGDQPAEYVVWDEAGDEVARYADVISAPYGDALEAARKYLASLEPIDFSL